MRVWTRKQLDSSEDPLVAIMIIYDDRQWIMVNGYGCEYVGGWNVASWEELTLPESVITVIRYLVRNHVKNVPL